MCEKYEWCDIDHTEQLEESLDSPYVWHRENGIEVSGVGVLRTDHVLNPEGPSISIIESIAWEIPVNDAPAFFAKLHRSIDEAEHRFEAFKRKVADDAPHD